MPRLLFAAVFIFIASCTSTDSIEGDQCSSGQVLTHACVSTQSSACMDAEATCDRDGTWQCPDGYQYTGTPCPSIAPDSGPMDAHAADRDCSDLGGGQAVLAERCLGSVVEHCIYSDTTQTASWTEIESCQLPRVCQEEQEEARCIEQ